MGFHKLDSTDELEKLEKLLCNFKPKSSQMLTLTRIAIKKARGQFTNSEVTNIFSYDCTTAENIPNLFVVCIQIPNIFSSHCVIPFTPEPPTADMVQEFDKLVDWGNVHLISQVDTKFSPLLAELCKSRRCEIIRIPAILYALSEPPVSVSSPSTLEESHFEIRSLSPDNIPQLLKNWKMAKSHSPQALDEAILTLPSTGIFSGKEELVSMAIMSTMGLINIVHTEEPFRRRGLGQATVQSLSEKIVTMGLIPCAEMEINNLGSQKLFEKAGFRPIMSTNWFFVERSVK